MGAGQSGASLLSKQRDSERVSRWPVTPPPGLSRWSDDSSLARPLPTVPRHHGACPRGAMIAPAAGGRSFRKLRPNRPSERRVMARPGQARWWPLAHGPTHYPDEPKVNCPDGALASRPRGLASSQPRAKHAKGPTPLQPTKSASIEARPLSRVPAHVNLGSLYRMDCFSGRPGREKSRGFFASCQAAILMPFRTSTYMNIKSTR